jgi:fibronectin type 3 domain-containing protein
VATALAVLIAAPVGLPMTAASAGAPDASAPTEPGTITVSNLTATGTSLKWGGSADNVGIEGYRVYRGFASQGSTPTTLIATTDAVTSYTATHLYSGTSYVFGVVAIDAANNKSAMRTITLATAPSSDTTAPAPPTSTSVSFRVFSSSRIDVVWGASTAADIAGYRLLRNGVQVGTVDLPGTPRYSDTGLAAATSYSYSVKAVDSAGNASAPSTAKSAKTLPAGTVIIARGPYLSNVTGDSAVISWWTNAATTGTVNVAARSVTDPTGAVQHHAVAVTGLSPDSAYPYTVTSGSVSAGGTLHTAAAAGTSFSFAAIGDFGGGSTGETQNAANIAGAGTQFIQTVGDDIYPSSGLPDPNFTTTYSDFDQRFFKPMAAAIRSQAFFPANGNKEYYGDGEFWTAFPMPGTNHSWYSYDWGDAHILVLDSEQPIATGSDQYNFAQADLAAHQGATWRIVALQRPPYSSTTASSSSKIVQQYLVPLFQTGHVQLVLSGNSHNYERTYPLTNGVPTAGGVTYVVTGAGGNGFNTFTGTAPAYSAFRESSYYEYAKVTVSPTALTVNAIRSDTNAVVDQTTISGSGGGGGGDTTKPTPPTNLGATALGSGEIDLAWTASSDDVGVTGYRVYRDGGTTAVATVSSGTRYADTGLAANSSHRYTVTAIDAAGNESAPSNSATATTAAAGGAAPRLVQTAAGTTNTSLTANFSSGTSAGDLLVVTASLYTGDTNHITSITDSAGNTWTRIGAYDVAGHNSDGEMWYAPGAKSVTAVTVHTGASSVAFHVQEFSGVATNSPLAAAAGASNTSSSPNGGPITVPAGDLVIAFAAGHGSTQPITLSGAYTPTQQQTTTTSGSVASIVTGSQVQGSAAGSLTVNATASAAMYWAAGLACFHPGS